MTERGQVRKIRPKLVNFSGARSAEPGCIGIDFFHRAAGCGYTQHLADGKSRAGKPVRLHNGPHVRPVSTGNAVQSFTLFYRMVSVGDKSTCPGKSEAGLRSWLAFISACAKTPRRAAIVPSWSPSWTMY